MAKKAIADGSLDQRTVGIAIGRAIIIGDMRPNVEDVAKRERIELDALLTRVKAGTLSGRDRRFLDEAQRPEAMEDMEGWRRLIDSIPI